MRWVMLAAMLASGCRATLPVAEPGPVTELIPVDSVVLSRPAVGLWLDGDDLLVLEASGTRILRLDLVSAVSETIPLTTRLVGPQGVCADKYYFYVYDANTLYRVARDKLVLSAWMSNVRIAGIAQYAPAEMLVADANRGAIWYKGFFGESRQFVPPGVVRRPGAMVASGDGSYCVLSDGRELVLVNRLGMVVTTLPVPEGANLLAADSLGRVWVGQAGVAQATAVELRAGRSRGRQRCRLAGVSSPAQLAAGPRLAVLDGANRILIYELP